MRVRDWEKGKASPIPINKYERFKESLIESSDKFKDRNSMLFILGVATGFRLGDLVNLTVGELKDSLDNGYLTIQESKQYKQWLSTLNTNPSKKKPDKRSVKIGSNLAQYLTRYLKGKKRSEYAFPSNKLNEPISAKSYSAILKDVGQTIGIQHISGHSLRKTYATKIYERSGRDLEQVRIALNHQSIEETKRYLGIKEKMAEDASRIADEDL